jgi:hypothetical protein
MPKFLESSPRQPRWYVVPVRILAVTVIVTLLSFAISLFLGICAVLLAAKLRGFSPDLRVAYRFIAAPAAAIVGAIVLVSAIFLEVGHYRRAKTLNRMERQMSRAD